MKRVTCFFVFGAALSTVACHGPTGVGLAELHVEATKSDGTSVAGFEGDNCTVMPILLGSVIEDKIAIETPLKTVVSATRDDAHVSFDGATNAPSLTIDEAALRSGYSEELDVTSSNGVTYTVLITSKCPAVVTK